MRTFLAGVISRMLIVNSHRLKFFTFFAEGVEGD